MILNLIENLEESNTFLSCGTEDLQFKTLARKATMYEWLHIVAQYEVSYHMCEL